MAKTINAHITGTVWKIEVKVGDKVEEGTVVAILESMKMEMPVEADAEGTVAAILVTEGQSVTEGAPIVELALSSSLGCVMRVTNSALNV